VKLELENSFREAQVSSRRTRARQVPEKGLKVKLRKAVKPDVQELLRERELHVIPVEAQVPGKEPPPIPSPPEVDTSTYHRVEHSPKERGLSPREREAINSFVNQLISLEDRGVGVSIAKIRRDPLSIYKILNLLKLKYVPYFTERIMISDDYYRFAAELVTPHPGQAVINPSAYDGLFAIAVLDQVYSRLENALWAQVDSEFEVVQADGVKYRLAIEGTNLEKKVRGDLLLTQTDFLDYFIENNFASIEGDRLLAQSAKYNLRLAGFTNIYLANRDFLSQLPEVLGEPPNEQNEVSMRFDLVFGNFTFLKSPNLAANYLDQSLRLLDKEGVGAFFVAWDLLLLLKDNPFMEEVYAHHNVRYLFHFPKLEGIADAALIVLQRKLDTETAVPAVTATVKDVKELRYILVDLARGIKKSSYYEAVKQEGVSKLIK